MRIWIGIVAAVVGALGVSAQERLIPLPTPKRPEVPVARPAFIVGVFQQPTSSFDMWRLRGINTLVGYEGESGSRRISNQDWTEAAAAKGFCYIRQPANDLAADAKDPNLLAWMHADEPDVRKPPTDPKVLADDYAEWKNAGPNVPVFVNFSGGHVLGRKVPKETYLAYLKSADWVGNDFYAVTGYNRPDWLWKVGAAVDELREWSNNKPQFAFIESSAQRLAWTPKEARGVTPGEFRAEVWDAVIHGVKGVVYFPQQIGEGFKYDATPAPVALEMSRQNRRLSELGAVLAREMNPKPYVLKVDEPLEAGWRVGTDGRLYVIVLNFSDKPVDGRRIRIDGGPVGRLAKVTWESREVELSGGAITEGFAPYEVRIYDILVTRP
jgi:hypothetical protein